MVIAVPDGLATVNLNTRAVERIVGAPVSPSWWAEDPAGVLRQGGAIYATHLDTKVTRVIVKRRAAANPGRAGGERRRDAARRELRRGRRSAAPRGGGLEARWAAKLPMAIYTVDIASGAMKTVHRSTDWLNHVQFSPDRSRRCCMFCHEGPWHKRGPHLDHPHRRHGSDASGTRGTMDMEIAGHEFFSADGKTIWYDLQTPRSEVFWLAGVNLGQRTAHAVRRGARRLVGALQRVAGRQAVRGRRRRAGAAWPRRATASGSTCSRPAPAGLVATPLVDLSAHDYTLEPNVTFTPDGRWLVFKSNMHGAPHVYAVELAKPPRL